MKNYFSKLRKFVGIKTVQEKRVIPWFKAKGDSTLRLDYDDLTSKSVVFDVGGYVGQWSSDIFSKYCCNIYIFEPVKKYAIDIKKRFKKNNKIFVKNFGLDGENKTTTIQLSNDGSSVYRDNGKSEQIRIVKIVDFMKENHINHIDLMKINIEGGEYGLLENLIEEGYAKKIGNIQVQFHDFVPNAKERMNNIQKALSKTHRRTYSYEFVWENWKLK